MKAAEKTAASELIVEGFMDDPYFVWVTPDDATRRDLLNAISVLAVDAAAAQGFLTLDERGVTMLIPPGHQLYEEGKGPTEHDLILKVFQQPTALLEDYRLRIRAAYPEDDGSWYLRFLVVPAAKRSQGLGSSMMMDILAQVGSASLLLHTGRPENLSFYARFGVKVVATTPCQPGGPYVYTLRKASSYDSSSDLK